MIETSTAVTFLFTDIEGSTRLWESEPARMADALARHDRLCRTSVEAHGGHLVKMIGDGLHAAFGDPAAAVASVLELQRGMARISSECGIDIKIRCGVHAGECELRDGDYFGSTVNRAARIAAAAHGGQVLLSQAVVDLGRARFAKSADVVHLGRIRLRDLSAPEDVWQLAAPGLLETFPALRSLDSTPNNLPQQATSFIGREKEIAELKQLMGKMRLLTLTGAGGSGKTRLAVQVAADLIDEFADGVWLVELAALSDPQVVAQSIAGVLGLKEERNKALAQTVVEHLSGRQVLLILDNAEHLLAGCAQLATAVLRQCPQAVLLVTSREALRVDGELTYRVPSLPAPNPGENSTPELVSQYESARLFIERAQFHSPRFVVTAQNAPALAAICSRLDGIPLALELAAGRVRSMSVEEVNQRLDQTFRLLTGGSRTALPRQQTLRALIDWSYDLLNPAEQSLLWRVAVFAGGWTLEAAERVCSGEGVDEAAVLDLLTSLADKSLLQSEERDGATRYRLLETVRQYARDRMLESGQAQRWRDLHLAYFLALAEEAAPQLTRSDQRAWLDRVEVEHDNLRSALTWSSEESGDAARGLRLAAALWYFWFVRGYLGEGRRWLTALLAAAPAAAPDGGPASTARSKALSGAGALARLQGDYADARAFYEQSRALREQMGDRQGAAAALGDIGLVDYNVGDYGTARVRLNQSIEALRGMGDTRSLALSLNSLGMVAAEQGDYAAAHTLYEESIALQRKHGDRHGIAMAVNNLGIVAAHRGDLQAARALWEEGLAIRRELGDRRGVALTLHNLAFVNYREGDKDAATARFEESLIAFRKLGDRHGIALSLGQLGGIAAERGDYPAARALLEESLAMQRQSGNRQGIANVLEGLGGLACDQGDAAAAKAFLEEALGIAGELGDRLAIAAALEGVARVAAMSSTPERAARLWGAAAKLREDIGAPHVATEQAQHERRIASARAAQGDDAQFDAEWLEGRALSAEQAIGEALRE